MAKTSQPVFLFGTMVLLVAGAPFIGAGTDAAKAKANSAPAWLTRAMQGMTSAQVRQEVQSIRKTYLDTHDVMIRRLANVSESAVLSVGYRLAPEHPFPSGLEDCYAAVLWAAANAGKLGIDPNKIATAGDSAGGNLSTGVVQLLRDRGGPKLIMQVLFYPTTAGFGDTLTREQYRDRALIDTHFMALVMRSYIAKPDDAWSPLFASLRSSPKNLPTTVVHSAGFDTLRDEGEQYAEMLKAAGIKAQWVRYAGAPHGFTQMFQQVGTGMAGRLSLDDAAMALKSAFAATLIP
jgi:acetyl esterase